MNYTPPEPVIRGPDGTGSYFHGFTEAQLRAEVERVRRETVEECAIAATDAVAFNGGSVQMEAHVRQAIRELLK